MLDHGILQGVESSLSKFNLNDLYHFSFLDCEGAENLAIAWREDIGEAYQVSAHLVVLVEELYASAIVMDEDGD